MIALEPMPFRRWVAQNPEALICPNCHGTGTALAVDGSVENCVVCHGDGELWPGHVAVGEKYSRQLKQDEETKRRWQKKYPTAFGQMLNAKDY